MTLGVLLSIGCGDDSGAGPADGPGTADGAGNPDGGGADGTVDGPTADGVGQLSEDGGTGIPCGPSTICTTAQECCVANLSAPTYDCVTRGDCATNPFQCDGPEDCDNGAAERCCFAQAGSSASTTCHAATGPCGVEICHTATDCSDTYDLCCASPFGGGYCAPTCM